MPKKTYFQVAEEDQQNVITAVKFSHGQLDETKSLRPTKWQMYRKRRESGNKGKDSRIVTGEVEAMNYVGKNFGSDLQTADSTCDYYIGVLNKDSRKLRVLPAELFHLHPVIEDALTASEALNQTYREKTDDLTKEFGSGKMQRALNKRHKNRLDSDMLSAATKSATENTTIVKEEEAEGTGTPSPSVVTQTSAVPPHDTDATRPEDVYRMKDILHDDMLSGLHAMAAPLVSCTKEEIEAWQREKTYTQFVVDSLQSLSVREDTRLSQCVRLAYIDCLMKVFVKKAHQLRLKEPLPVAWNVLVRKKIMSLFFEETLDGNKKKRTFPNHKRDLLLSHILVLCLNLRDFRLDLDPLLADLGVAKKRLITHCQILGCTVKAQKGPDNTRGPQSHVATLAVPLKFPELKSFKSKGKREF